MRNETGVYQRHTRRCPSEAGGRGYAPHKCTGTWTYVIDVGRDSNSNRVQEKKGGFQTRQDARSARAARMRELRGRTADAYSITVAEYLDLWLSRKRALRESTRVIYRRHIDDYLGPRLGSLRLVDLERHPDHIEDFFTDLTIGKSGKPLSPASVRRIYGTLRGALNTAVKKKLLAYNPALSVELPATEPSKARVWDAEQAGRFLDYVRDDRLYALYLLVVMAGLRRGEVVGLRWEDVRFDTGYLRVAQQVVEVGGQLYVGPPKTKAGERMVALDPDTVAVLKAHRAAQLRERLAWGEGWHDTGLVFTREDGQMLKPAAVTIGFRATAKKAGVPVIRFHDLRHTCATLALAADVPMKVVSDRLGHSTMAITANLYTAVLPAVAREAALRIANVVPHTREGSVTAM
jgi:integrase